MSRKDYEKFASMLRHVKRSFMHNVEAPAILEFTELCIADLFAADSTRFDRERFYKACEPKE